MNSCIPTSTQRCFSDYIVYVDESGDHSLTSINPRFPIFVLAFCVFRKSTYNAHIAPAVRQLKFDIFGHDMIVLHEAEILRKKGKFAALPETTREVLLERLNHIIGTAEFGLVAVVMDKQRYQEQRLSPVHAYHLALEMGLERVYRFLQSQGQEKAITHIVCEARGPKEDAQMHAEFVRICEGANMLRCKLPFELVIADKKTNSEGLQLADLVARPIGLSVLRPEQSNRAAQILEKKFYRNSCGQKEGFGLKVFPPKPKT